MAHEYIIFGRQKYFLCGMENLRKGMMGNCSEMIYFYVG